MSYFTELKRKWYKYQDLSHYFKNLPKPPKCTLPAWMEDQITQDITTASTVRYGVKYPFAFVICCIKNGKIRFHHSYSLNNGYRILVIKRFFLYLVTHYTLPNCEFAIQVEGDCLEFTPAELGVPALTFAKQKSSCGPILMPDIEMLKGYTKIDREVEIASAKYPWESKQNMGIWRGATTGGGYTPTTAHRIPRMQLVNESLQNGTLFDARFTQRTQCADDFMLDEKYFADPMCLEDHFRYKYLIDVDGNSCTYSRLYWILRSNSVLLKHQSDNIQWYYGGLQDKENAYYFTLGNGSTLSKLILWLRDHDKEAHKVAENGRHFCIEYLNMTFCVNYVLEIITRL